MFRALVGYIFGFISGIMVISALCSANNGNLIISIGFAILLLISSILIAYFHHKKKRQDYYNKIKNGRINKYL